MRVTALDYTMPDINHTFLRGHRMVVQVAKLMVPAGRSESAIFRTDQGRNALYQSHAACFPSPRRCFFVGPGGAHQMTPF